MYRLLNIEPRDFSETALARLREVAAVDAQALDRAGLLACIQDYDILITRLGHQIDEEVLARAKRLQVVVSATTGLDHIDLTAAQRRGIAVLSLRGETAFLRTVTATAELTWALILALVRNLPGALADVRQGNWRRDRFRGGELQGKTLGVVGVGRLGRMVAAYGRAFGMRVLGCDPAAPAAADAAEAVDALCGLDELLAGSDVVSLHVPLAEETVGLIGRAQLAAMRPTAILVNTSRGRIVDEAALLDALRQGRIAGAGLDVLAGEETTRDGSPGTLADDPLVAYARAHDNLLITPHVGGATLESMHKTEEFMAEKLLRHLAGPGRPGGSHA